MTMKVLMRQIWLQMQLAVADYRAGEGGNARYRAMVALQHSKVWAKAVAGR